MNNFIKLKNKILSKKVKICIIGLGYVGLPLAVKIANLNSNTYVLGIEVDQNKID